jgi:hypothetical protein
MSHQELTLLHFVLELVLQSVRGTAIVWKVGDMDGMVGLWDPRQESQSDSAEPQDSIQLEYFSELFFGTAQKPVCPFPFGPPPAPTKAGSGSENPSGRYHDIMLKSSVATTAAAV